MDSSDERQATLCHLCQCAKWPKYRKIYKKTLFLVRLVMKIHMALLPKWHKLMLLVTLHDLFSADERTLVCLGRKYLLFICWYVTWQ